MNNTKVTIRTFIGNTEASSVDYDDILQAIDQEEKFIKRISSLQNQTEKLKTLVSNHKNNVVKLTEILETELCE